MGGIFRIEFGRQPGVLHEIGHLRHVGHEDPQTEKWWRYLKVLGVYEHIRTDDIQELQNNGIKTIWPPVYIAGS
jgi:hypothetical protein